MITLTTGLAALFVTISTLAAAQGPPLAPQPPPARAGAPQPAQPSTAKRACTLGPLCVFVETPLIPGAPKGTLRTTGQFGSDMDKNLAVERKDLRLPEIGGGRT